MASLVHVHGGIVTCRYNFKGRPPNSNPTWQNFNKIDPFIQQETTKYVTKKILAILLT